MRKSLNFFDRLNEVYNYLLKNGGLPYKCSNVTFSDGTFMGEWLNIYKEKLNVMSSRNNQAKIVYDYLSVHEYMPFDEKLDEVYDYYIKNGTIPQKFDKILFSDGTNIYHFLTSNIDKLREISHDNEKARIICEKALNLHELTLEDRIDEMYETLLKGNIVYDKTFFSDGLMMYDYLEKNIELLERLGMEGHSKAKYVSEEFYKRKCYTIEERIRAIYQLFLKTGKLPSKTSSDKFKDQVLIGEWIYNHRDNIKDFSEKGNQMAKEIHAYIGQGGVLFNIRLKEFYDYVKFYGLFSAFKQKVAFRDGAVMYDWFMENREKIKYQSLRGNVYAEDVIAIYDNSKTRNFNSRFEELIRYIEKGNPLPSSNNDKFFSDGVNIYKWIKFNKTEILKYQNSQDSDIKSAVTKLLEKYPRMFKVTPSISIKLKEAASILISNKRKDSSFLDDGMSFKYFIMNNEEQIRDMAFQGNSDAIILANYLSTKRLTVSGKINQLSRYIRIKRELPRKDVFFTDNSLMATWLDNFSNQLKIYNMAVMGNENALIVLKFLREQKKDSYDKIVAFSRSKEGYMKTISYNKDKTQSGRKEK